MKTMPKDKEILTIEEAIGLFCLSRRKFRELLKNEECDFAIKYCNSRTLILKKQFEEYLSKHPEIRRRYEKG